MGALLVKLRNQLRRTLHAFLPGLARDDDRFVRTWLTAVEYRLYLLMDVRDRSHSVLVARELLSVHPDAGRNLVSAALLHDVAKSQLAFNPWHRIIVHLSRPRGLPGQPLGPGLRGAMQLHEHHEVLGARMLRDAGVDEAVAVLVEGLGRETATDFDLRMLREADERT